MFCVHLKRLYHAFLGLSVVQMSIWLIVLCKSSVSLLIFCILVLSIIEKCYWNNQISLWVFLFIFAVLLVFALCILKFCYSVYKCLELLIESPLDELTPLLFWNDLHYFWYYPGFGIYFGINIGTQGFCFILSSVTVEYLFPFFSF